LDKSSFESLILYLLLKHDPGRKLVSGLDSHCIVLANINSEFNPNLEMGIQSSRYGAQTVGAWTRAALSGIRKYMPATQELDLAGCPVVDDDVAAVLTDLRSLERLVLDGCQKLYVTLLLFGSQVLVYVGMFRLRFSTVKSVLCEQNIGSC
jgi:hypothetical protein